MLARAIVMAITLLVCGACAVKHTVIYPTMPYAK